MIGVTELGPDAVLVDENEGVSGSDDAGQFARGVPGALGPLLGALGFPQLRPEIWSTSCSSSIRCRATTLDRVALAEPLSHRA